MIKATELSFSYGKKQVLHQLELCFAPGKLYAVIGTNGSGKTTLLHILAHLHRAKGTLTLDGIPYAEIGRRELARRIGLLPQEAPIPQMTVGELVALGRYPHVGIAGALDREDRRAVRDAMQVTDTLRLEGEMLKALSGGERRRANIAMLLAQNTPYVLLDEPVAHLDIAASFSIMELLCQMRDAGKCVIAVLHDLSLAMQYADEIIVLQSGKLAAQGTPDDILAGGAIPAVFGVTCYKTVTHGDTGYLLLPASAQGHRKTDDRAPCT